MLRKLHDPSAGRMRVAAFMSGSGTNLEKIIGHQKRLEAARGSAPFAVAVIFTDNYKSRACEIGAANDLPVVVRDMAAFYRRRGLPRRDLSIRAEYDAMTVEALRPYGAPFAAYAGYMSVASPVLVNAFLGVNVHPADLSVEVGGKRRFVGGHAVRDAIRAGETAVASSTHVVEDAVDGGRLVLISEPMNVEIPRGLDLSTGEGLGAAERHNQDLLKVRGDWEIFPLTLELIADGRIATDENGMLHLDGAPIPKGKRLPL
ncbi:MAG: formyltransferase family protein [Myxococcota bacterium]|jgi:folate-dependent phosphoribosylglycinamide formyltransferase PurN